MEAFDIYKDIGTRTGGDIYIGIVGPVRTGKSTFIKKFMEMLVIPNIENQYIKERTVDELPQSADGTAIMTTEPKFVPNEAVEININDVKLNVRLIDCVGYIVDGATGHQLENGPRMVSTPWSDEKMPFTKAAEIGTKKVIKDHSTLCLMVTNDGTITDLPRENYISAENTIAEELKGTGKPFVIILNTKDPENQKTLNMANEMSKKYSAPVLPVDCKNMTMDDINSILETVLYQFPIIQINIHTPKWIETLASNHWLKENLISTIKEFAKNISGFTSIKDALSVFAQNENIKKSYSEAIDLGTGSANIELSLNDNLFYNVLSETTGMEIDGEYELISTIKLLAQAKKEYDKMKFAIDEVKRKGYGIVSPSPEDMTIEKPTCIKQGNRYGLSISAKAPAIHMIKSNINANVATVVGTEEQSKELVNYLTTKYNNSTESVLEYEIFGRSLSDLINDDLNTKILRLNEDTQSKIQDTIEKILNTPVMEELSVFYFKRHFNCPILGILYKKVFHFSTLLLFTNIEKCHIIYLIVEKQSCPLLLDEAPYLSKLCLRAFLIYILTPVKKNWSFLL